jgi:hypothetical protein
VTAGAAGWPVCWQCARPAQQDLGPSLDPRARLIVCAWEDDHGYARGHGKTLGTLDVAAAQALVDERRRKRLLREHPGHQTASGIHRECPTCQLRGAHLDHIERKRLVAGCRECDTASRRVRSAHVGP